MCISGKVCCSGATNWRAVRVGMGVSESSNVLFCACMQTWCQKLGNPFFEKLSGCRISLSFASGAIDLAAPSIRILKRL